MKPVVISIVVAIVSIAFPPTSWAGSVDDALDDGYQKSLPERPAGDFELPPWLFDGDGGSDSNDSAPRDSAGERRGGGGHSGGGGRRRRSVPNESGTNFNPSFDGLGTTLLWMLAAIALIALAVLVFNARRHAPDEDEDEDDALDDEEDEEDEEESFVAELMKKPLKPHEELAAAGRWNEAIHSLLLMVLTELIVRSPIELHDALTSRELLAELQTYVTEALALRTLVYDVEECHFGHATADELRYHRCLEAANSVLASIEDRGKEAA